MAKRRKPKSRNKKAKDETRAAARDSERGRESDTTPAVGDASAEAQASKVEDLRELERRAPEIEGPDPTDDSGARPAGVDLDEMWKIAKRAEKRFDAAREQHELGLIGVQERIERAKAAEQRNREDAEQIARQRATLQGERDKLAEQQRELGQREEAVLAAEAEADAGFEATRQRMLADVRELRDVALAETRAAESERQRQRAEDEAQRREDAAAHVRTLADARARVDRELAELREREHEQLRARAREHASTLERERAELREREDELEGRQRELDRVERRQGFERERLRDLRDELSVRIEQGVADVREELEAELGAVTRRLDRARQQRDELDRRVQVYEQAERSLGQRSAAQVAAENEALRAELQREREALAARPSEDQVRELELRASAATELRRERDALRRQLTELQERLANVENLELRAENLQARHDMLESSTGALREACRQQQERFDELVERSEGQTAFPQCRAIDIKPELLVDAKTSSVGDLGTFVEGVRHRIAAEFGLFYTPRDLQIFVAGLAMDRLLLLHGISGTGKTSLPLAFAKVVGGESIVVEVQAGWRDPEDLIGHYNSFERRFHETELLQGLYRAQSPAHADRIHLVVLDEMNLAHPEQYFSEFLSVLPRSEDEQSIALTTMALANAPERFVDGRMLRLPPNAWFVGTANHDETTKGFADKTHDRALVMKLDRHQPFEPEARKTPRHPLGFTSLRKAFAQAAEDHAGAAEQARASIEGLRDIFDRGFRIGWGARLGAQLDAFAPVVVATGGSVGLAVDHMLTTRILRKLVRRYDSEVNDLQELYRQVAKSLTSLEGRPDKPASLELLSEEIRRKKGEVPDGAQP